MREVRAVPITPEAFARYGDVVSAGGGPGASANQGTAVRYDWSARLENARAGARPNLAVFRSIARALPIEIALLEKHPGSTQTFLPMVCGRLLVCVAPDAADGTPDVTRLEAFLCVAGQGVSYLRGVWHHPIVALDLPAELAMLAWEDGTAGDCVEHGLAERVRVVG
jgi:ureidoglycolate lyase